MREAYQAVRDFISRRRNAYCKVFLNTEGFTPYGGEVLQDLAKFCRAHESTFSSDPRAHAVAEGRREVWLRIQKQLKLTDEQLWALYPAASSSNRRNTDE